MLVAMCVIYIVIHYCLTDHTKHRSNHTLIHSNSINYYRIPCMELQLCATSIFESVQCLAKF